MEMTSQERFLKNRSKLSRILKRVAEESGAVTYDDVIERISEYVLIKFKRKKKIGKSVESTCEVID